MTDVTISCQNVNLKNYLTINTHARLGAFDYITNGENNACSLMPDSLGSWGVDSEAWFPNPSDKHDYTAYSRVWGLVRTSWYVKEKTNLFPHDTPGQFPTWVVHFKLRPRQKLSVLCIFKGGEKSRSSFVCNINNISMCGTTSLQHLIVNINNT